MIWHLHAFWNAYQHLSPYKVLTLFLTVFLWPCTIMSPWPADCTTGRFTRLNPLTYSAHSSDPPPFWQPPIRFLYLWVYFNLYFLRLSTEEKKGKWYLIGRAIATWLKQVVWCLISKLTSPAKIHTYNLCSKETETGSSCHGSEGKGPNNVSVGMWVK